MLDHWLPRGSFLRHVGMLTGGTVFAQALTTVSLPVLTRLYSPDDFKLLAVYVAIIGILTVISNLRYNMAVPLPQADSDALALLVAALLAACCTTILCALPLVLMPDAVLALIGQSGLKPFLWMIPAGVLLSSVYNALQYWTSRKKRFGLITRTRIVRALGGMTAQLVLGVLSFTPSGLLVGQLLNGGMGSAGLLQNLLNTDKQSLGQLSTRAVLAQAKKYKNFPIYSVPEALFNEAGVQLPLIIIAATVAGPEAAFLFLAMRVCALPMSLIGSSIAQVFLAEAPAKMRDGTLSGFTNEIMLRLFKYGASILVAVGIISPWLFGLLFGAEWARAGWLVAWMTPWFILQFVVSPVSTLLHILGRQRLSMCLQLTGAFLRIGAVLVGNAFMPTHVSEIFAVSGAVFYACYIGVVRLILQRKR